MKGANYLIPVVTASGALLVASSLLFDPCKPQMRRITAAVPVRSTTVSRFEERPGVIDHRADA